MSYLLDTNVVSELRKREHADRRVREWMAGVDDAELFLSVLTLGELRRGIDAIHRRQPDRALALNRWLQTLVSGYAERILPIDATVADAWGKMTAASTLPVIDGLLAATAHVHALTVVTRNTRDIARTGVPCLNPFAP